MSNSPTQAQQQPAAPNSGSLDSNGPNVEDLYLESYTFTTAAAIVGSVDRKTFVLLRDGRNIFGILRTFDQFANLVLQDAIERIYLKGEDASQGPVKFGEAYRGVFMVRGENVVMMGELDIDREDDHLDQLEQIPFDDAERELKLVHSQTIQDEKARSKRLLSKGLINDFTKSDLY
ncbi:Sm-like ribonucleo protein [Suhomyces tanzawaensis NRRL Y-17324]|uniref:U6 snRNA-associated Sm-like protein LSm1 n=1 Tax=Suhomyces tanzawaensis NRRL Y-17324 TaxID=984487 RepID=A0A1E4SFR4_9ASCO|nr:Sm-like ribonucleo protein [Suhomyces tanzawaensis NRRL Y-17324]ODV78354.1 Sm-like ribonucleo protein [Suhomyces tanzawaensis NRRL Y-17324]